MIVKAFAHAKQRETRGLGVLLTKPICVQENGPYRTHASRPMPWGASGETPEPAVVTVAREVAE